jgi:hypothetical protein
LDSFEENETPIEARYTENLSSWKQSKRMSGLASSILEFKNFDIKNVEVIQKCTKSPESKQTPNNLRKNYNFISKFIPSN